MERKCYFCGRTLEKNGLCPVCSQDRPTQILRPSAPKASPVTPKNSQVAPNAYQSASKQMSRTPQPQILAQSHKPTTSPQKANNLYPTRQQLASQSANKTQTTQAKTKSNTNNSVLIASCCVAAIVLTLLFVILIINITSNKDTKSISVNSADVSTMADDPVEEIEEDNMLSYPEKEDKSYIYNEAETYSYYWYEDDDFDDTEDYICSYPTESNTKTKKETTTKKQTTKPASNKTDAQIYKEYLLNGGYEEIAYFKNKSELEIKSCLVDADKDGRDELLIEIADTSSRGSTGYPTYYAYLDIKGNKPVIVKKTDFCGGTAGGGRLSFLLDNYTGEYVLALKETSRDGVFAYSESTEIYSISNASVRYNTKFMYTSMDEDNPTYKKKVEELKNEILYYYYNDNGHFTYYQVADTIASESDYNSTEIMYLEPSSSAYQLKSVSYNNPIA